MKIAGFIIALLGQLIAYLMDLSIFVLHSNYIHHFNNCSKFFFFFESKNM